MTRNQWMIVVVLVIGVLLVYCLGMFLLAQQFLGQPAQTVRVAAEPTDTPTPRPSSTPTPTSTPQATATLVIPVSTRASPTARATVVVGTRTAAAGAIQKAFDQSAAAKSYRLELEMTAQGDFALVPGLTNPNQALPMFGMSGEVNGKDNHFVFKGWLSTFLGGDMTKGFEIMRVGDKTFVKGPLPMLGAPDDKWYVADSSFKSSFSDPNQMLNTNQNADLNGFRKTGTEPLDGKRCDVYTAGKESSLGLFRLINTAGAQAEDTLGALDNAETRIWICEDGYLRQLTMRLDGHNKDKPTQKISMQIKFRISNLNVAVKITPPANAAPMQAPSFFFGTPTATPTRK